MGAWERVDEYNKSDTAMSPKCVITVIHTLTMAHTKHLPRQSRNPP